MNRNELAVVLLGVSLFSLGALLGLMLTKQGVNQDFFTKFDLPAKEKSVINEVAKEYGLSYDQKKLLYVIRKYWKMGRRRDEER